LVAAFWEICLLKRRPQDIPASRFLFNVVVGLYVLQSTAINLFAFPFGEAFLLGVVMTMFLLLVIRTLLQFRRYPKRMLQAATAMMGASIVLFLPVLALRYWFHIIEQAGTRSNLAGYVWVFLFVWELFISAHILRHALNTRLLIGFFLSIAYVFLEFQAMFVLHHAFGQSPG
jgi:hypothetical protein